jgi:hypothetical protein
MAEPKPLASLSAGLLARKGAARPAMRRQAQALGLGAFGSQEDLGWNDMGYDVDPHHGGQDLGRTVDHGLSPMSAAHPGLPNSASDRLHEGLPDALDALGEAVDRAISPVAQPAAIAPIVAPLDSSVAVPHAADAPAVHQQQQRIEQALGAVELSVSAAPLPANPVPDLAIEAIRSAINAVATPATPAAATPAAQAFVAGSSRQPQGRSRAGSRGNFAFTLRLDPHRHLRLRLASATSNRSAQQIIIQLIDDYLADLPEIDAFAAQVPASRSDS